MTQVTALIVLCTNSHVTDKKSFLFKFGQSKNFQGNKNIYEFNKMTVVKIQKG